MTTSMNPAPVSYDRSLALTTMHYRAPSFGTVAQPDTDAVRRMRGADGSPDGITRCAGCGADEVTLVQGFCGACR